MVADQLLHRHAGLVVEPGIRRGRGVAVVFVQRAMKLIGPALGDQHHLAARRAPLIDAFAAHRHAEFLDGIERNRQHGVESGVDVRAIPVDALIGVARGRVLRHQAGVLIVVDIHAIQRDVILIAPRAQDLAVGGHARLQAEQLDDVSGFQWKLADLGSENALPTEASTVLMVEASAATLTVSVVLPNSMRRSKVVGVFTSN